MAARNRLCRGKTRKVFDDHVRHLKRFASQEILFTSSCNIIHKIGCLRVNNWLEVRNYFFMRRSLKIE
ncbi:MULTISPECIES: 5' nucleotidase, NT5C type [unclassified Clostridium]|uniref:5' nucleotidase, NT5C type n=1 Tax=unclassified Clostridium TaxID=2614128 RepID=UPI000EE9A7F2|nr:hypothetical protein [Clostridium sp.]